MPFVPLTLDSTSVTSSILSEIGVVPKIVGTVCLTYAPLAVSYALYHVDVPHLLTHGARRLTETSQRRHGDTSDTHKRMLTSHSNATGANATADASDNATDCGGDESFQGLDIGEEVVWILLVYTGLSFGGMFAIMLGSFGFSKAHAIHNRESISKGELVVHDGAHGIFASARCNPFIRGTISMTVSLIALMPATIIAVCFFFGFILAIVEGWEVQSGILYLTSNVFGLGEDNTLSDDNPETTGAIILDLIISTWACVLATTAMGFVAGMCLITHMSAKQGGSWLSLFRYLLIYIPIVISVSSFLTGSVIAILEDWALEDGFYFMMGNAIGLAADLVENQPETAWGTAVEVIAIGIELCFAGAIIGLIGSHAKVEALIDKIEGKDPPPPEQAFSFGPEGTGGFDDENSADPQQSEPGNQLATGSSKKKYTVSKQKVLQKRNESQGSGLGGSPITSPREMSPRDSSIRVPEAPHEPPAPGMVCPTCGRQVPIKVFMAPGDLRPPPPSSEVVPRITSADEVYDLALGGNGGDTGAGIGAMMGASPGQPMTSMTPVYGTEEEIAHAANQLQFLEEVNHLRTRLNVKEAEIEKLKEQVAMWKAVGLPHVET
jgi:hypothetical protein